MLIKRLIISLCGLSILAFMTANADSLQDNCASNGYPIDEIVRVEKNIQEALKTNDLSLLADQFQYPLRVNLISKKTFRIISDKKELMDNFSLIYDPDAIKTIVATKDLNHPFCRGDGASIFNGMWLTFDDNKHLKVFAINAPESSKLLGSLPYGEAVLPVGDLSILTEFARRYNRSDDSVKNQLIHAPLRVNPGTDSIYKVHFLMDTPEKSTLFSYRSFLLYRADMTNDGQDKWILVYPCEGSMCTSGIDGVYQNKDEALQAVSLAPLDRMLNNGGYLFVAKPFITSKSGKTILNFYNNHPAQVCGYLWENNVVKLVHGNPNYCIH